MRIVEIISEQRDGGARRSHAMQCWIFSRLLLNTLVGCAKPGSQPRLWVVVGSALVNLLDSLYGNAASFLPTFISAHAIGHHSQAAFALEFCFARRLPIRVAIFIILSLASHIAQAPQFNPRTNPHCTSHVNFPQHCDQGTGLYRRCRECSASIWHLALSPDDTDRSGAII